jgi:hypothetical protein
LRTTAASIAAAFAGAWMAARFTPREGAGATARALPGALGALVFASVFLVLARLLKSPELAALLAAIQRRRKKP